MQKTKLDTTTHQNRLSSNFLTTRSDPIPIAGGYREYKSHRAGNLTTKDATTEAHNGENRDISHLLRLNELRASAVIVVAPQRLGLVKISTSDPTSGSFGKRTSLPILLDMR